LLHLVLSDENWNKIGETWVGNLPAGSFTKSLNFTVTNAPSSVTNYLQVRLLKANWEELGVNLIEEIIQGASNNGFNNTINWVNFPQNISIGNTYTVDLIYGLQQSGLIYLLLMNENWEKIGEAWSDPLNAGNNSLSLPITVDDTPSNKNNYIQAQILNINWENVGIEPIQETITLNNNPNLNAFDWINIPASVSAGSTYPVEISYTLNEPGLIYLILMDNNWNKIGEDIVDLNQGSGIANLTLEVTGNHSLNNNYLQANLFDVNWQSVGESMISKIIHGGVADVNSIAWNNINDLPTFISTGDTYMVDLQYNLNVDGLLFLQIMDADFNKIGEDWTDVLSPGSGVEQLSLLIEGTPSNENNYIQAQLFDKNWNGLGVNAIQQTINHSTNNGSTFGEYSSNDPPLTEYHTVFPIQYNSDENGNPNPKGKQLTGTEGFYVININDCDGQVNSANSCSFGYASNWFVGEKWKGPIKAYFGPATNSGGQNFWLEWENQQVPNQFGYTDHAETDVRVQKDENVYAALGRGFPKKISDINASNIEAICNANGQWTLGSAGRGHINLTLWVRSSGNPNDNNREKCDIIIHIWDNSGDISTNNNYELINPNNPFSSGGLLYDVIQRPGDFNERGSFNIVPRINGQSMVDRDPIFGNYPANATIARDYSINVMDFINWLINNAQPHEDGLPVFDEDWFLTGIDWTITAQSAKKFDNGETIPASKGRWTFNEYSIPDLE